MLDYYKCVINQALYILSEGDNVMRLKVNAICKIIDDNYNIFCIITDRLTQYCKVVREKGNKANRESAELSLHQ